jgi:hypothetical protein
MILKRVYKNGIVSLWTKGKECRSQTQTLKNVRKTFLVVHEEMAGERPIERDTVIQHAE